MIAAPLDALGVNYYNPTGVRAPEEGSPLPFEIVPLEGYPRTAFDWPVVPDGLRELLVGLRDRYGADLPPMYVTESGCAYDDALDADGRCDDPDRIAYLDGHLAAVRAARERGCRRPRLLRLVAHGQLGVGRGFHQAVRPRPRRLPHRPAYAQELLPLVPGAHP